MSLFEDGRYQWRETYFVLFANKDRPAADKVERELSGLGPHYEVRNVTADEQGRLESLTLVAHHDYSAMDITYLDGEEVLDQVKELKEELRRLPLAQADKDKLARLDKCDARYDVFHFEEMTFEPDEEDEMLDPGALLIVLERLARICHGVGIDPQSGTLM